MGNINWSQVGTDLVNFCVGIAWKLLLSLVVLVIGNILIRFALKRFAGGRVAKKMDPTALTFIKSFLKIGLYIVLLISIVGILGVEMASIITVLATCGAALALALQGSLSNLAGGLMLLIFRPFRAGDYIEASGEGGTVVELGIFYTVLLTPNNQQVTIPNGSLISSVIVNYSKEKTRRVVIDMNVAYGTNVEATKELIMGLATSHKKVLNDPAPFIRLTEMADKSLKITLRVWCDTADYWDVNFDLTEAINKAFVENNISVAVPKMDVRVKND